MCGSVQIDGHVFCEGLAGLELSVDLQAVVNPVVQLIRDAPYRPKHELSSRGVFSMGELLDTYRSCRATLQHDKIYALLGLSAEGLDAPALQPDYGLPWHEVFRRVTAHTFGTLCTVKTWPDSHTAVITGKCLFLGQIKSVYQVSSGDDQVRVWVQCTTVAKSLGYGDQGWDWAFPRFPESVREGDIVCHLQGAAKPSIVRLCQDHFTTIKTTAPSVPSREAGKRDGESYRRSGSLEDHFCNIALTFTIPPGTLNDCDGVDESAELLNVTPGYHEEPVEERKRLDDTTTLLGDCFARSFKHSGDMSPAWKRLIEQRGPEFAISERVVQVVVGHPAENSVEVLRFLFEKGGDKLTITEKIVGAAAANYRMGYRLIQLLVEKRGEPLPVSEHVMVAAAKNDWQGYEIMKLLFEHPGRELVISEEVVVAAADNCGSGYRIMPLLFEQRGEDLPISERVVKAVAANTQYGYETMRLLFEKRGEHLPISEHVVVAAAGNNQQGYSIVELLFEHRGRELVISEEVAVAAAGNYRKAYEIMELLFEHRGREIVISEEVVVAAADNCLYGYGIIRLLFEQRGEDLLISERVIKAAAANTGYGVKTMKVLFQQRESLRPSGEVVAEAAGNSNGLRIMRLLFGREEDLVVSENAITAAAGNKGNGYNIMRFLLGKRGREGLTISEAVVKAAQDNPRQGRVIMELFEEEGLL